MKKRKTKLQIYSVWYGLKHIYYGYLDYTAKQQLVRFYENIRIIKI